MSSNPGFMRTTSSRHFHLFLFRFVLIIQILLITNAESKPAMDPACEFDSSLALRLQGILEHQCDSLGVSGAAVAVVKPGFGAWQGTSGMSDSTRAIEPEMLFSLASITKTFIAALVLKLAEDGELSLDDSLHRWLPAFQYVDSTITIRQLLNHTSGVFSYHEHPAFWDTIRADVDRIWTPEEVIRTFTWRAYFPPGEDWHYSNNNYILLGMIIREATGDEVSVQLRERLLEPLELDHTYLDIEEQIDGYIAHGWHDLDNDQQLEDISYLSRNLSYSIVWTAGAMVSNAIDVSNWAQALFGGEVLEEESLAAMLDFVRIPEGWTPFTGYGLGITRLELGDRVIYSHMGDLIGYSTLMLYSPNDSLSVAVLVNSSVNNSSNNIAFAIFDEVINQLSAGDQDFYPPNAPAGFILNPAFPNPFNRSATVSVELYHSGLLSLTLYDVRGREVMSVTETHLIAGYHSFSLPAGALPSGKYIIRAHFGGESETGNFLLLR